MAPDPYRRMNGSPSTGSRGWTPPDSSHTRLQLDNLLRRELRVADPRDAKQVAEALFKRYEGTPRALAIEQEARGLPVVQVPTAVAPVVVPQTSSSAELQQALDDVDRDLRELTTSSLLKDVTPELEGWARAIRTACQEGANAARFGLDARQRDKALAIRRQLGDYARMSRIVGALTPNMNAAYRKLAQSCDEAASVLLVMVGEALANVGFKGGQFLLQVPYTELQVRRDAVIYALRNLVGATQEAYGSQDWPRGLTAYRQLFQLLDEQGQADLRALLVENELARTMDELIQRAGHGSAEGLRAVGATSQIDLARFRRLALIGQDAVNPQSPPLAAFLEALWLFAHAFTGSGGSRLLSIARPAILHYGLYQNDANPATRRLLRLVTTRGALAQKLDCTFDCTCGSDEVERQIALDMALYQLDRVVDLYALGDNDFGEPERRAAAYWLVFKEIEKDLLPAPATKYDSVRKLLGEARKELLPDTDASKSDLDVLLKDMSEYVTKINKSISDANKKVPVPTSAIIFDDVDRKKDLASAYDLTVERRNESFSGLPPRVPNIESTFGIMHDELCVQQQIEKEWEPLVRALTPGCLEVGTAMKTARRCLENAIGGLGDPKCMGYRGTIPATVETLFESRTFGTSRRGRVGP